MRPMPIIVALGALVLLSSCGRNGASSDTCGAFIGHWIGDQPVTLDISKTGDTYLVQAVNGSGFMSGNFSAKCVDGRLAMTGPWGDALIDPTGTTINWATVKLHR